MVRGFYQLGTGVFAQTKKLNTISNNIANAETVGYKKQTVITQSFKDMVLERVQNVDGQRTQTEIGNKSSSRIVSEVATLHTQGSLMQTDRKLDAAIIGEGFFQLQTPQGPVYTRKGNFNVDDEGYLMLQGNRVMGKNGPIRTGTDEITINSDGDIYNADGGFVGSFQIVNIEDYKTMTPIKDGFYTSTQNAVPINASIRGQSLEGSNVDTAEEITSAIAAQRELQTQTQMLKMYDTTLQKATNQISKLS